MRAGGTKARMSWSTGRRTRARKRRQSEGDDDDADDFEEVDEEVVVEAVDEGEVANQRLRSR